MTYKLTSSISNNVYHATEVVTTTVELTTEQQKALCLFVVGTFSRHNGYDKSPIDIEKEITIYNRRASWDSVELDRREYWGWEPENPLCMIIEQGILFSRKYVDGYSDRTGVDALGIKIARDLMVNLKTVDYESIKDMHKPNYRWWYKG